jgi:hypothetical protein
VFAINMSGHAIAGLGISPLAMACSPTDSTLAYVSLDSDRHLFSVHLSWSSDTIYAAGGGTALSSESYAQRSYIDWAKYSEQ